MNEVKMIQSGEDNTMTDIEYRQTEEFKQTKEEILAMLPSRYEFMRKSFHLNKTIKWKRDNWIRTVEEAEKQVADFLKEDYVHYLEWMPDVKEYLRVLDEKESKKMASKQQHLY